MAALRRELSGHQLSLASAGEPRRPTRVVISGNGRTCHATVRTTDGFQTWQQPLTPFMHIREDNSGRQHIELRPLEHPNDLFVFVWLGARKHKPDRFFLLTSTDLQELLRTAHQWQLDTHGGTRPIKPDSTHCALSCKHLEPFEDCWPLVGAQ